MLRWSNAIMWAYAIAVLGAIIGPIFGVILGGRLMKVERGKDDSRQPSKQGKGCFVSGFAAILAGPTAAALCSIPAFYLGYYMADDWLPTPPPPEDELAMALPFLATLAGVLGFPCVLIAWACSRCPRRLP